jgi:carbonic anhydrase
MTIIVFLPINKISTISTTTLTQKSIIMPTVNELLSRNSQTSQSHRPLPTIAEAHSAGEGPPRIALISCCDARVVPEEYFGLKPKDAIVFRTIAGHPQGCWKDLVALDTFMAEGFGTGGFEELAVVHHTGTPSPFFLSHLIFCLL